MGTTQTAEPAGDGVDDGQTDGASAPSSLKDAVRGVIYLSVVIGGLLVLVPGLFILLRVWGGTFLPEIALPLLLIVGAVLLLLAVGSLAIAFSQLDLASKRHPLGLPEGSVRAVIALLLVLLFFITAVFLYSNVARGASTRTLEGVTTAQLAAIPVDEIVRQAQTGGTGDDATYEVVLRGQPNEDSVDIAKSVLTTVGTLVVSVAAFYFGSRSVEVATQSVTASAVRVLEASGGDGDGDGDGGSPEATPSPTDPTPGDDPPSGDDPPPPDDDPPVADPLGTAETEEERLAASRELMADTDNGPRGEDGDQDPQLEE